MYQTLDVYVMFWNSSTASVCCTWSWRWANAGFSLDVHAACHIHPYHNTCFSEDENIGHQNFFFYLQSSSVMRLLDVCSSLIFPLFFKVSPQPPGSPASHATADLHCSTSTCLSSPAATPTAAALASKWSTLWPLGKGQRSGSSLHNSDRTRAELII